MAVRLLDTTPRWVEIDGSRFHIRSLDAEERARALETQTTDTGEIRMNLGVYNLRVVEFGLLDWENVEDASGNPVEFSKEKIKLLPTDVLTKLANEILGISTLSTEEEQELRG